VGLMYEYNVNAAPKHKLLHFFFSTDLLPCIMSGVINLNTELGLIIGFPGLLYLVTSTLPVMQTLKRSL
jgi:hypothetical protein